jgi:hypothetical protein
MANIKSNVATATGRPPDADPTQTGAAAMAEQAGIGLGPYASAAARRRAPDLRGCTSSHAHVVGEGMAQPRPFAI